MVVDVGPAPTEEAERAGRFHDRKEAGRRLGAALAPYLQEGLDGGLDEDVVVLALPRGGVLVGYEVARALSAPLEIWVVRKIGAPGHEELGLGAVAEGGYTYFSPEIVRATGIELPELARLTRRKSIELERRTRLYRGKRPRPSLAGKVAIVVDDGIATGGTIRAVAGAVRLERPRRLVLAVPVAAADTIAAIAPEFDDVVALAAPTVLHAVGLWYEDFRQVDDREVIELLAWARRERGEDRMVKPS